MESLPLWVYFAGTVLAVIVSVELGYLLGRFIHARRKREKESPVSAVAGSALGLVAFMLAFTFSIVAERFDARKSLVRDEANAIRTAYLRADLLPEADRDESKLLLRSYVDGRLAVIRTGSYHGDEAQKIVIEASRIMSRLWELAVVNGRKDMNSDVGALYIESLNQIIDINALRVAIGAYTRIPEGIWIVLFSLTVLGMTSMGYQAGISGSERTLATSMLALSFAFVISLIASLDQPAGFIKVPQQPLIDLQRSIASSTNTPTGTHH